MHIQNPFFPFIYSILAMWKKTGISVHILIHEKHRQSLNRLLGCVLYLSPLRLSFLPWYLTDVKCKEWQGECKRLSHSCKAWAPLDISSKYSSLQTLTKKASLLLHFKRRDFFFSLHWKTFFLCVFACLKIYCILGWKQVCQIQAFGWLFEPVKKACLILHLSSSYIVAIYRTRISFH